MEDAITLLGSYSIVWVDEATLSILGSGLALCVRLGLSSARRGSVIVISDSV